MTGYDQYALGNSTSSSPEKTVEPSTIANGKCYLLEKLSREVRNMIWGYAVTKREITPTQCTYKSNVFFPYRTKFAYPSKYTITAVALALTCHQIYDEVAGTGLFYKTNNIAFTSFNDMLTYLVAIVPIRKNAIRSVTFYWNGDRWNSKHAFAVLSTCEGLKNVEVKVNPPFYSWERAFWVNGTVFEGWTQLRGLKSFRIVAELNAREKEAAIEKLSREIEAVVTQPRLVAVPLMKIKAAQEASKLNIFGEGRLGPDLKPGMVSSRTRGELRRNQTLDKYGLQRIAMEKPKYSKFGDLLWDVDDITQSRELDADQGKSRIEVYVTWATSGVPRSWESLDSIINVANVLRVVSYYMRKPEAYDLGVAMSAIEEFVEADPDKAFALECLNLLKTRKVSSVDVADAKRRLWLRVFR